MIWGQLRLSLQTGAPGFSLDLIDEYLRTRYEQVLNFTDWKGLSRHATIQTTAAYQSSTDSVTLTVGTGVVTGAGTNWTAAMVGKNFYRPGDMAVYRIDFVPSTGLLTLDRAYEGMDGDAPGTVSAGAAYVVMQNVYTLPNDCRSVIEAINPVTGRPLEEFDKDRADESWGPRTLVANPGAWALYDDTREEDGMARRRIEFFPPPLNARGIPIEYRHAAVPFDGGNTANSPLPWITDSVLLFGCRADIAAKLQDYAGAKLYEMKFEGELARLALRDAAERRQAQPMRMAARFTRHRMERAARGLNRWPRLH